MASCLPPLSRFCPENVQGYRRVVKTLSKLRTMEVVATEAGFLRIGELSRRTGVAPELLRAWERRYGLLRPTRSSGGVPPFPAPDEGGNTPLRRAPRPGPPPAPGAPPPPREPRGASGGKHTGNPA